MMLSIFVCVCWPSVCVFFQCFIREKVAFIVLAIKCAYVLKSRQSCPALCKPMNSPPGSLSIIAFSRAEYWSGVAMPPQGDLPEDRTHISYISCIASRFFNHRATVEALQWNTNVISALNTSSIPACPPSTQVEWPRIFCLPLTGCLWMLGWHL